MHRELAEAILISVYIEFLLKVLFNFIFLDSCLDKLTLKYSWNLETICTKGETFEKTAILCKTNRVCISYNDVCDIN